MSTADLRVESAPVDTGGWFRCSPQVLQRTIPGIAVLLLVDPDDDVVVLAGTGMALWQELTSPRTLEDVALRLAARYGTQPDLVRESLDSTLELLLAHRVVQRCDG